MGNLFSLGISILSIIVGICVVVGYCAVNGLAKWSIESASWILFVLGAPTTLLDLILQKTNFYQSGILKGIWNGLPIWLLYLLQYQLIALLIYKGVIDITTKKGIFVLIGITIIILISVKITWSIFRI
jgi:hypothetical protein